MDRPRPAIWPPAAGRRFALAIARWPAIGSVSRRVAFAALPALILAAVTAAAIPAQAQVLRRGNGADPATLDPHRATGVPAGRILRDLYEGLISEGPAGELVPGVAERWEIGPDGREYTFHLRPDAAWSNGDPVLAEDFRFAMRRAVNPATASDYAFILAPLENAEGITAGRIKDTAQLGVEVLGPHTLKITLKAPTPYFLAMLTHSMAYPVHRPSLTEHGDRFTRPGNLVSNGAYRLEEWTPQDRIRLVKNESYWGAADVSIPEVEFHPTEDQNTELRRYRAGELDMTASVPVDQLAWVKENLAADYRVSPYLGTYYYILNLRNPPFKDNLSLRLALSLAIDREIIAEKVARAGQVPAYGWIPPGVRNYHPQQMPQARFPPAERIRRARSLFAKSGYSDRNPLELEILYNTSEGHKKIAVAISSMWRKTLGVRTRLINQEWKVFLSNRKQGNFQVARAGWIGDYNDANTFAELMLSDSGINDAGWHNADYDERVRRAALTADEKERGRQLEIAERILLLDHPIIPIYFYVSQSLVQPHVLGWQPNILDHHATRHLALAKPR